MHIYMYIYVFSLLGLCCLKYQIDFVSKNKTTFEKKTFVENYANKCNDILSVFFSNILFAKRNIILIN